MNTFAACGVARSHAHALRAPSRERRQSALFLFQPYRYTPAREGQISRGPEPSLRIDGWQTIQIQGGIRMPQPTRPVIGINVDFQAANKLQCSHLRLNSGYADAVLAAGG